MPAAGNLTKGGAICEALWRQIVNHKLTPGSRLPTRAELEKHYKVSSVTVQRALEQLTREGFVCAKGRLGTFVAEHPPHLCRYGLVFPNFRNAGDGSWGRLYAALCDEAGRYENDASRQFRFYYGVWQHTDVDDYQRLKADLKARRLAGVIYVMSPSPMVRELIETSAVPSVAITALAPEPSSSLSWIVLDLRQFFDAALDHFAARRRTRVAALVIPATWRDCVEHLFVGMAARGMSTDTYLVQSVSERHPHWANPCVRSLMRSGEGRPDGLFITDDTLVEDALAGLVASGLRVPADVEVVTHCNFPWPAPSVLPVKRLGYDVRLLLQKALQLVDPSVRRGKSTECMTMPAIFGDQQT